MMPMKSALGDTALTFHLLQQQAANHGYDEAIVIFSSSAEHERKPLVRVAVNGSVYRALTVLDGVSTELMGYSYDTREQVSAFLARRR